MSNGTKKFESISGVELLEQYSEPTSTKELAGEYPYTRGIHRSMYRGKLWTMRQYAGFGSAREANKRYRYLIDQGTTGLSVAFDLPTQMGRDSDHPRVKGEVGRVGVAISTIEDMQVLLEGIPLDKVSVSMTINSTAPILLALLLVVAEQRGTPWNQIKGTIQNDILKEYIARGTYIYPPEPALRLVTDVFRFCQQHVPQWNTISISGYHIREAGSTAVDELAFTFANAITYVEAALARGLPLDEFAPRLAFFFNCQIDFLEEISKFRAARRIWAKIMKERFNAQDPRSMMARFHTQTAGSSLTAQQPLNNVVRTTIEALAAVLGGTQSLHTNGYDEALSLPSEESATLALRTQQIIAFESGVAGTVDPLGGSYVIESLTQTIEANVFARLAEIESQGGMLRAIENGFPQREIERSAYEFQTKLERGERILVGVNEFTSLSEEHSISTPPQPEGADEQLRRLKLFRDRRDNVAVEASLKVLSAAALSGEALMEQIIASVRCGATLGEISEVFRTIYGEFKQ